jgi:hypothetical protein
VGVLLKEVRGTEHTFGFRKMELEKRNKKIQIAVKSTRKCVKGKSISGVPEEKSCFEDAGGCLEKRAEYLDTKSDTHTDGSPTFERAEVKIQIAYSLFNYGDAVVVIGKYILEVNSVNVFDMVEQQYFTVAVLTCILCESEAGGSD